MRSNIFLMFALTVAGVCQDVTPGMVENARSALGTALLARNPDTRMKAVQAMSLIGPRPDVLAELKTALGVDKDLLVKLAIVDCLAGFKDEATVPALERAMNDDTPELVLAAARVLYNMKKDNGRDVLFSILIGEEKASSGFISSQKRDYLRMLTTPRKLMIMAAGMAPVPYLGIGVSSAQAIMNDPAGSARAGIILLVQDDPDPAIQKTIRAAINDKDWSVRAASIHVLAVHKDTSAVKDIVALMDDKNDKVRLRAAAAIVRMEPIK